MERNFHRNEIAICGLFAPGNESAQKRKVRHSYRRASSPLVVTRMDCKKNNAMKCISSFAF